MADPNITYTIDIPWRVKHIYTPVLGYGGWLAMKLGVSEDRVRGFVMAILRRTIKIKQA